MKVIFTLIWLFVILIILSILLYFIPFFFNVGIPFKQSALILIGSFTISVFV